MFALGRTETIHPISDDSKAWVHSMQPGSTVDGATKVRLLKSAVNHQRAFRLSATMGEGCDRHLLGLYCASRELGMDIPKIFMDKVLIILVFPPGIVCPSNCALPMPGTADGDAISHCQVLGRVLLGY